MKFKRNDTVTIVNSRGLAPKTGIGIIHSYWSSEQVWVVQVGASEWCYRDFELELLETPSQKLIKEWMINE